MIFSYLNYLVKNDGILNVGHRFQSRHKLKFEFVYATWTHYITLCYITILKKKISFSVSFYSAQENKCQEEDRLHLKNRAQIHAFACRGSLSATATAPHQGPITSYHAFRLLSWMYHCELVLLQLNHISSTLHSTVIREDTTLILLNMHKSLQLKLCSIVFMLNIQSNC